MSRMRRRCSTGIVGDSRVKYFRSRIPFKTLLMEISEQLRCLFSANIEEQDESYVIKVPEQEIRVGDVAEGETYRVAVLPSPSTDEGEEAHAESKRERGPQTPPVEEGEQRTVEIEDIGEQGDGIARVERGFVVIVPDTEDGERVTVEITDVRENVAFAEVVERVSYYD
jgi:predicted RNA-binding protein with TRAM domain